MKLAIPDEPLNPKGEPDRVSPFSYLSIALNRNLKPKSLSGEQALYLAYLAIISQDFIAAKHYLDTFSKGDAKKDLSFLLACMYSWVGGERPKDPITEALVLRSIGLIYEKMQFAKPDTSGAGQDPSASTLDLLFDRYLHNRNNTGIFRLSDEDEKRLLQRLFAYIPLSSRNFARLTRLQSGTPLNPTTSLPNQNDSKVNSFKRKDTDWLPAESQIFDYLKKCSSPWSGSELVGKCLLTRPEDHFIRFFIDCCLNFDDWQTEPKRTEAMDQLRLVRHNRSIGISLMHDCLNAIFEYPDFFADQLKKLHAIKKSTFSSESDLEDWFHTVSSRYKLSLIEFPQQKEQEIIDDILSLKIPASTKTKELFKLTPAKPFQLLKSEKIKDVFLVCPLIKKGRMPAITHSSSRIANVEIEKMNKQLDEFYAKRQANPPVSYALDRTKTNPKELSYILSKEEKLLTDQLREQKQQILEKARTRALGEQSFFEEKRKAGGQTTDITMDELVALFFKGDAHEYLKRCPGLDANGVQDLSNQIFSYLQDSTCRQQIRRSLEILDEIIFLDDFIEGNKLTLDYSYPSKEDAPFLIKSLEERLAKEMIATPSYEFHKVPEYLAIEYFSNIRLRPQQIETLNLILSGLDVSSGDAKELIVQLTMGSGKTKVLLPLLAMKIADGEKLAIIVVLPSLMEVNKHDQAETTLQISGQRPFLLDFHRNSSIEPSQLRFILHSLQNAIVDKHYIMATPSSFKCLQIIYKELMIAEKNQEDNSEIRHEQIELLRELQNLLKTKGVAILDEADTILEPRRSEVNFPVGPSKKVSSTRKLVHKSLLKVLLSNPLGDLINVKGNKQKESKEESVVKLKETFVDLIIEKYTVPGDDLEAFRRFFLGDDSNIPNLEGHPSEGILKRTKDLVSTLLPSALLKVGNENFGRSHASKKRYAIPYIGNNSPNERGEFGHVDEIMLYSAFIYIQEGLKPYDVDYLIDEMVRKVRNEAKASRCAFEKTKAYGICVKRFGIKNIFNVKQADRERAASSVRSDLKTLWYWMDNFVYTDIKSHNQKISANFLDFDDMFFLKCGFTGTPRSRRNYPRCLQHPEMENVIDRPEDDIAILDAIWRHVEGERADGDSGIHVVDAATPTQYLEAVLAIPDVVCLLDTGALIKGISNKEAAESIQGLINKSSPLKGTVYFNEDNSIVVHLDGCEPVALDTVAISERFSYYDQVHTTGVDIKQSPRAKAVLTYSYNTVRDMTQGSMRMRQLLTSNAIELLIPKSVAEKMHADGAPQFTDILKAGIIRQAEDSANDLEYFIRQDMSHIISQKILDLMLSLESVKESAEIADVFETILKDTMTDNPSFKVMKPTLEILEKQREQKIAEVNMLCDQAQNLSGHLKLEVEKIRKEAVKELSEFMFPEEEVLPEKRAESTGAPELDCQLEIEKEIEVNEESQKVQQKNASYMNWITCSCPSYKPDFLAVKNRYNNAPQVITLADVFRSADSLYRFDGIFSPQLRTTKNFVISVANQKEWAFVPNAQKKCSQLVFYKEAGDIIALMVDSTEAAWLRKALSIESQKKNIKSMHVSDKPYAHQVYFLDVENGFFDTLGVPFSSEEKQRMIELTAEAKFFSGDLVYSDAEWEYLKGWISSSGKIPLLRELFERSLNSQPGQFKFYEQTALQELLNETDYAVDNK